MNRRSFSQTLGLAAFGAAVENTLPQDKRNDSDSGSEDLLARDVNAYLRSLCEVDEPSVDRIVLGDPDTVVSKIGTAWMPYWSTCKKAVEAGINCLVVHEPTFYTHWDLDSTDPEYSSRSNEAKEAYLRLISEKKQWCGQNGLVIIRCHDVLDRISEFGIPFALGKLLGFGNSTIVASRRFFNVYKVSPQPANEWARTIAESLQTIGQPGVAFYGEADRMVGTIGLGTGYICDPLDFMDLKPDLFVAIDDTIRTWIQTTYAEDSGHPLVVINHGTAEENGMRLLSAHLKEGIPQVDSIHLDQGCGYRWITA